MKCRILGIVFVFVMLLGTVSVTAVDISSGEAGIFNAYFEDDTHISADIALDTEKEAVLIAATYDESGLMVNSQVESVNESGNVSFTYEKPLSGTVKAYLWSGTDSAEPLCDAVYVSLYGADSVTLRGIVTANDVTSLTVGSLIDTSADATVTLSINNDFGNADYSVGSEVVIYEGATLAGEHIGREVVVTAVPNSSGELTAMDVIDLTQESCYAAFTLDSFYSFEETSGGYDVIFGTEDNSEALALDSDAAVIYNGVAYSRDISKMFGSLLYAENSYSGKVEFIDNDRDGVFDVAIVKNAVPAVVDRVENGIVYFTEFIGYDWCLNEMSFIDFDETNTSVKISLTKNSEAVDYTEFVEGDVLSIVANNEDAFAGYYDIKVMTDNVIIGEVESVSASMSSKTGMAYRINGVDYDMADCAYTNGITVKSGVYGMFWLDEYNKIIAFRDTSITNYIYVLSAGLDETGTPYLDVLDRNGNAKTLSFSEKVKIEFPTDEVLNVFGYTDSGEESIQVTVGFNSDEELRGLAESMAGLILIAVEKDGYITEITMPSDNKDNTLYINEGLSNYNISTRCIRVNGKMSFEIEDDTPVFLIGNSGTSFSYGEPVTESVDICSVISGAELVEMTDVEAAVYVKDFWLDNMENVIVIYNVDNL